MKKKNNSKKMLLNVILILIGIAGLLYFSKKASNEDQEIINNAEYSSGVIIEFHSSTPPVVAPRVVHSTGTANSVSFDYSVNGTLYNKEYTSFKGLQYIPNANPDTMIGNKYLVIYNKRKPKDSRILFNYPIRDSADFKRYIKQLSK